MASRTTRALTLSLSLLLASTSLASAGFIWLSPDQPAAPVAQAADAAAPVQAPEVSAAPYAVQTQAPVADGTETQGRAWKVEEPTAVAPTSLAATIAPTSAEGVPSAEAPVALQPEATASGAVLLRSETVAGTPAYSKGDQQSSASVAPAAPMAAEAPIASAPVLAPEKTLDTTEHVLGQMKDTTEAAPVALSSDTKPVELTPAVPESAPATAVSLITGATVPVAAAPAPVVAPKAASAAAPAVTDEKVVNGFGKQVPLVIALRQILPSDYGFAHRDGVDLTQSVDWQGGRAWPQVLNDAITPIGLKVTITADTVLLEKVSSAEAPAAIAPAAAAPVAAETKALAPMPKAAAKTSAPKMAPELKAPTQVPTSSVAPALTNSTIMQAVPSGK